MLRLSFNTISKAAAASALCSANACRRGRQRRTASCLLTESAGSDYVIVGRVTAAGAGAASFRDFELLNALTGEHVANQPFSWSAERVTQRCAPCQRRDLREDSRHPRRVATRIAYVAVDGQPPEQHYQLIVADSDGESAADLESRFPLMSPVWSPDGQWLAYVSFENKDLPCMCNSMRSGERRQVSAVPASRCAGLVADGH